MRAAMLAAEVGDDVWGEDPTVRRLEARAAERLGQAAGLFFPSGTMANQVALATQLRPGDALICADIAHIHVYEGGGLAANAGATTHLVPSDRGRFRARDAEAAIQPDDVHAPRTRVIAVEDTCNKGGGAAWDAGALDALAELCRARGLAFHLDGARVMNRLVARGDDPRAYGARFDSISVCLSKGLGAPVGSVLLGSAALVAEARRVRKRMGGGMRQAGFLAAAGLYALEHHVERLAEDHRRARVLGEALLRSPAVEEVLPVETNIVLFSVRGGDAAGALRRLADAGVRASGMGRWIRFVTHLGVDDAGLERALRAVKSLA
jgi:threonine aldolase